MTLTQLLSTLNTKDVMVTLVDAESQEEIVTLKSPGYASLDDALEARTVRKWEITSATKLTIILNESV